MEHIEEFKNRGKVIAYVIRQDAQPASTTFFTEDDANFQSGFVVYPKGGEVVPHIHLPIRRELVGTAEYLMVRSGECIVTIFDEDRSLVAEISLKTGDAILSVRGGHGFRMIEDTVLLEIKQGPYSGGEEKERFHPASEE